MEKMNVDEAYATKTQLELELKVMNEAFGQSFKEMVGAFIDKHGLSHLVGNVKCSSVRCIEIYPKDSDDTHVEVGVESRYAIDDKGAYMQYPNSSIYKKAFTLRVDAPRTYYDQNMKNAEVEKSAAYLFGIIVGFIDELSNDVMTIPWSELYYNKDLLAQANRVVSTYECEQADKKLVEQVKIVKKVIKPLTDFHIVHENGSKTRVLKTLRTRVMTKRDGFYDNRHDYINISRITRNLVSHDWHLEKDGERINIEL